MTSADSDLGAGSKRGARDDSTRIGTGLAALLQLFMSGALLAVLAFALTLGALEGAVRMLVPQDLDFFNTEKIVRPATQSGARLELIPGARSASYIGVPVSINSVGLRDDHEVTIPKPPGLVRVLGVGDSVTFGYGVRLEETS